MCALKLIDFLFLVCKLIETHLLTLMILFTLVQKCSYWLLPVGDVPYCQTCLSFFLGFAGTLQNDWINPMRVFCML